ncbi:MAG TPA: hypothetical protein VN944_01145 [Nitrospiria bacterium]|nr:hypothetical protein [Nitrospiria bacterium]
MSKPEKTGPGYSYYLSDEQILKYMGWSLEARLTWLEEANRFLFETLTEEKKEIQKQFRQGKL